MPDRPLLARRRPLGGRARAGAIVAVLLAAAACSGGDDTAVGDPVPTLLTAPLRSTSTTSAATTTVAAGDGSSTSTTVVTTVAASTTTTPPTGGSGLPSGPGALPTTSSPSAPSVSTSSAAPGASSTAAATSTTADIEPPPPSVTSTQPIPTAPQPPDTIGGREVDFLLAPTAITGLQFGASRATVLERLRSLLGDPRRVDALPDCPGGPATALQWFNAAVILTDRGLAFYQVGMNVDDYEDKPVPFWHTASGLTVGADRVALDAVYPQQITYGEPSGAFTPFTVSAGPDAGITGRLDGDVVDSVSAGTTTC